MVIVLVWLIALAIFLFSKLVKLLGKENAKVFASDFLGFLAVYGLRKAMRAPRGRGTYLVGEGYRGRGRAAQRS